MLLIYGLIRLQALLRFHSQLWSSLDPARRSVLVDWPSLFLGKLGTAWNVPVDGVARQDRPQRIDMGSWIKAHFELGIRRMTWSDPNTLVLKVRDGDADGRWTRILEEALGGQVKIQIHSVKSSAMHGE